MYEKTDIHFISNLKQCIINDLNTGAEHIAAHYSYLNCLELEENVNSQNIAVGLLGLNPGLYITGPCCKPKAFYQTEE